MSWVYEVTLRGGPETAKAAADWFARGPRSTWAELPGLVSLDSYVNAEQPAHDPYNNDGAGPLLLILVAFASREALASAVGRIVASMGDLPDGVAATGSALERRFYPVGEGSEPAPLEAPLSYVVRYHRPADDEAAFVDNYLASHPVTQAQLPHIRAIICYLPLDELNHLSVPGADYMIGNEVVFDSVDHLNASMKSPVREELRAHYRAFPRFTGAVTHFPMRRVRHAG
jgi:hypothetical protein